VGSTNSDHKTRSPGRARSTTTVLLPDFRTRAVFDAATAGIAHLDPDFKITISNNAFANLLETPIDSIAGKHLADLFKDPNSIHAALRLFNTGTPTSQPCVLHAVPGNALDSKRRWLDITLTPLRRKDTLTGIAVTLCDVSVHVRRLMLAEEERQNIEAAAAVNDAHWQRQVASMLSANDRFLALLGHELRNPLTPILTWTQLLKDSPAINEQLHKAIAAIERSALHQKSLVDDLLDLASLHNGKLVCEREEVKLHMLLTEVIGFYVDRASEANVTLTYDSTAPGVTVLGDRKRLSQIVRNLLDNAIKFTPSGGSVSARLSCDDNWVRVDVSDTGIGIPKEFMSQIFKTFAQAQDLQSRSRKGLGLGLAIVKQLTERHGGRAECISNGENTGATFSVFLPLYERKRSTEIIRHPDWVKNRRRKVLIIEDGDDTREALRTLLESWGLEVTEATDGQQGLQKISETLPDLVLCDLTMPLLDGWSVVRQVRLKNSTLNIPMIALSGHGTPGDLSTSKASGFQDHLVKPFDAQELLRVLQKYLPMINKEDDDTHSD
jgi:signal transduction histidine kinase/CheY-like chemotaxis protein